MLAIVTRRNSPRIPSARETTVLVGFGCLAMSPISCATSTDQLPAVPRAAQYYIPCVFQYISNKLYTLTAMVTVLQTVYMYTYVFYTVQCYVLVHHGMAAAMFAIHTGPQVRMDENEAQQQQQQQQQQQCPAPQPSHSDLIVGMCSDILASLAHMEQ